MSENQEKSEMEMQRRNFLKKAVYAAPTVVALGSLVKPQKAQADGFGPVPSDPDTN